MAATKTFVDFLEDKLNIAGFTWEHLSPREIMVWPRQQSPAWGSFILTKANENCWYAWSGQGKLVGKQMVREMDDALKGWVWEYACGGE